MRSALDEPPMVQLVQDVTHQMGKSQGWDPAAFPCPSWINLGLIQPLFPPHRECEQPWSCRSPRRTPGCPTQPPSGAGKNSGCSSPARWEHSNSHSQLFSHWGASSLAHPTAVSIFSICREHPALSGGDGEAAEGQPEPGADADGFGRCTKPTGKAPGAPQSHPRPGW